MPPPMTIPPPPDLPPPPDIEKPEPLPRGVQAIADILTEILAAEVERLEGRAL